MKKLGILVGMAGLALAVAACSSGGTTTPPAGGTKVSITALDSFKFEPATINAKMNEKVTVELKNTGTLVHDFTSADLSVATKTVDGGKTITVEFTPTTAGTFKFICSQGGHEAEGMTGQVVVA